MALRPHFPADPYAPLLPDERWPAARLSDLSRTLFEEEYLSGAFAPDILAANERSLKALSRYTVTVRAIDIFGNDTMTLVPVSVG